MNILVGKGKAMVELDDGASRFAERVLRQAAGIVVEEIEKTVHTVFASAATVWPEKTGTSLAGLRRGVRFIPPDVIEGVIYNQVPYVWYIKGRRQQGKHTWSVLIRTPMKKAAGNLAARIGPRLKHAGLEG